MPVGLSRGGSPIRPTLDDAMSRRTRVGGVGGPARRAFLLAALAFATTAAAAPKFEDTMAQRVLACTGCHGPQGRAAPDGYYPRIAGKPPGYLYNQLLNFR